MLSKDIFIIYKMQVIIIRLYSDVLLYSFVSSQTFRVLYLSGNPYTSIGEYAVAMQQRRQQLSNGKGLVEKVFGKESNLSRTGKILIIYTYLRFRIALGIKQYCSRSSSDTLNFTTLSIIYIHYLYLSIFFFLL